MLFPLFQEKKQKPRNKVACLLHICDTMGTVRF